MYVRTCIHVLAHALTFPYRSCLKLTYPSTIKTHSHYTFSRLHMYIVTHTHTHTHTSNNTDSHTQTNHTHTLVMNISHTHCTLISRDVRTYTRTYLSLVAVWGPRPSEPRLTPHSLLTLIRRKRKRKRKRNRNKEEWDDDRWRES